MTIRLVVGPPGAGKSTHVRENRKPEDTVIDLDQLVEVTGNLDDAKKVRDDLLGTYHANENPAGDLWVIRSAGTATPEERKAYAEKVKADEVTVIATPKEVAAERIKKRARPGDEESNILSAVDGWWASYGVVESDLIVRPEKGVIRQEEKMSKEQDKGFPPETPVAEMDDKQQSAYWKYHSRRHENTVKELSEPFGNDVTKLKEYVGAYKPPVAPPATDATADVRAVRSEFKAAVATAGVSKEDLDAFLEDLDLTKYLKEDGEVDEDRVASKAKLLAPQQKQIRRVPSDQHNGQRTGEGETGIEAGRALAKNFKIR